MKRSDQFPFVEEKSLESMTDFEAGSRNSIEKVRCLHEKREKYEEIAKKYPEQRIFKDLETHKVVNNSKSQIITKKTNTEQTNLF